MRGVLVARGDEEARGSGTHPERGRPLGQGPRRGAARSRDLARRWGQRCLGVRSRSGPGLAAVACRGRTCESRVGGGGDGKSGRPRAGRLAPGDSKMEGPAVRGPRRRARCAAPRGGAGRAVGSGPGKGGERGPEPGSRRSEGDAKNLAWGQSGLRYVFRVEIQRGGKGQSGAGCFRRSRAGGGQGVRVRPRRGPRRGAGGSLRSGRAL